MYYGEAVLLAKKGKKIARKGWNGKGMFVFYIQPDHWDFTTDVDNVDNLKTDPFLCMKTAGNTLVPWLCSQSDGLAGDWIEV